ncbi:conserved Plasmodium protein, unknown function [Plasmodium malariae]|uniref:Uncharacterized protein n=1 Tax=Plasmodium malariae TaxID=5858 RepID=A0A1C3L0Y3_PLAMA|nr:conserved Plasmodium protein, unknown function [Plasmodium malariae]
MDYTENEEKKEDYFDKITNFFNYFTLGGEDNTKAALESSDVERNNKGIKDYHRNSVQQVVYNLKLKRASVLKTPNRFSLDTSIIKNKEGAKNIEIEKKYLTNSAAKKCDEREKVAASQNVLHKKNSEKKKKNSEKDFYYPSSVNFAGGDIFHLKSESKKENTERKDGKGKKREKKKQDGEKRKKKEKCSDRGDREENRRIVKSEEMEEKEQEEKRWRKREEEKGQVKAHGKVEKEGKKEYKKVQGTGDEKEFKKEEKKEYKKKESGKKERKKGRDQKKAQEETETEREIQVQRTHEKKKKSKNIISSYEQNDLAKGSRLEENSNDEIGKRGIRNSTDSKEFHDKNNEALNNNYFIKAYDELKINYISNSDKKYFSIRSNKQKDDIIKLPKLNLITPSRSSSSEENKTKHGNITTKNACDTF